MSKNVNVNFVGFWPLLSVLFIALKLTHYIDWSWWWVLTPLWAPIAGCFVAVILFSLIYLVLKQIAR